MIKLTSMSLVLISAHLFTGCASAPKDNQEINVILEQETGTLDQKLAEKIMSEPPAKKSKTRQRMEGEIHRKVWWWMRYYSVRDRERFERNLERGESYRPLVQQILREHQLPPELYYLALIESGYVTHATSSTSAVGIWQFMKPTALHYHLSVEGSLDERQHPITATHAAARYLSDLYREFNSWYLAIAAYNAGQGRIARAVKEAKTRDFWTLAERGYLPQETMDYIPKFLAAATIGGHLEHFGFAELHAQRPWPEVAAVELKRPMKLRLIAKQASLSEHDVLRLNPKLKMDLARAHWRKLRIWLPRDSANHFFDHPSTVAMRESSRSTRLRAKI